MSSSFQRLNRGCREHHPLRRTFRAPSLGWECSEELIMSVNQSKPSGKAGLVVVILVLVIAVAALAWFWEPITYYTRLKMWDKEGPGRAVMEFLDAGAEGDQAAADRKLGTKELKPLVKQG